MSLNIPVILGTVRNGRQSEKVAHYMVEVVRSHGIDTQLIDIRNLDLPMDDDGTDLAERNAWFRDAVAAADGFIVVAPEYNHAIPGSLKRAMDVLFKEWNKKAVGFVGVSNGMFGGVRASENFAALARALYLVSIRTDLYATKVEQLFDENGQPHEPFGKFAKDFVGEVAWMADALQAKRMQG